MFIKSVMDTIAEVFHGADCDVARTSDESFVLKTLGGDYYNVVMSQHIAMKGGDTLTVDDCVTRIKPTDSPEGVASCCIGMMAVRPGMIGKVSDINIYSNDASACATMTHEGQGYVIEVTRL